jgi:recombination protein RecA
MAEEKEEKEKKEKKKRKPVSEEQIDFDSPECHSNISEWISTGIPTLDLAIGRGGIPVGRTTGIVGDPGVGKSSLVYSILTQTQKMGGIAVLSDTEIVLEKQRAQIVGLDTEKLILFQGLQLEDTVPLIEEMIVRRNKVQSNALLCVAVDTVSALASESDLSVSPDAMPQPGFHSRYLSFAFRRLVNKIAGNRVALILVHQPRVKIATMGYGSTLTWIGKIPTTLYSSVILQLNRFKTIKQGETAVGIEVLARVIRNKIAPPFRSCRFFIKFDSGIDGITPILDILTIGGKLVKKGGWYSTTEGLKFQTSGFKEYYEENRQDIDSWVKEIINTVEPELPEEQIE